MTLRQPLLEQSQFSRSTCRRQSLLWPTQKITKPGVQFEKRTGSRSTKHIDKDIYIYESGRNASTGIYEPDPLQFSNLSHKSSGEQSGYKPESPLLNQDIKKQEEQHLELIQQQSSASLESTECFIQKSQSFILLKPSVVARTKKIQKQKLLALKNKKQLTIRQKLDRFFGYGINSLILSLTPQVVKVIFINIPLDIIMRSILLYISIFLLLQRDKNSPYTYPFIAPLAGMLFTRLIFVATAIKMNYIQQNSVCVAYQKAFDHRSLLQIQNDRYFRRHYSVANILKAVGRSLVPPQMCFLFIKGQIRNPLQIYFMMNMIFKGIQIMIVLPMFVMTLLMRFQLSHNWQVICVSYILQQGVRYVVTFLIINTFSRAETLKEERSSHSGGKRIQSYRN